MNILFLNGSPRKNGYTAGIMKLIEEGINPEHKVNWVDVYDLELKPCLSCMKCRPEYECALPQDDGHRVARMIRSADALIIGSPTYFGNISGPLKTLIDRSLTAFEKIAASGLEFPIPLHIGKKAAIVTACNSSEPLSKLLSQSGGTILAIDTVLKAGGYDVAGSIVFDGAAAKGNIPEEVREKARELGSLFN